MAEKITITRKDLQIFRGTYEECMKQETVNMMFYLAWDTQQIFVGNKNGGKTPYSGQTREVITKYIANAKEEIKKEVQDEIDIKVENALKDFMNDAEQVITNAVLQIVLEDLDSQISSKVEIAVAGLSSKIEKNSEDIVALNNSQNALTEKTNDLESSINDARDSITSINNSLTDVNNLITDINSDISSLFSKDTEIEEEIQSLREKDTSLQSDMDSVRSLASQNENKIDVLNEKIENVDTGAMLYRTGDEIIEAASDISSFKPTFCTKSSGLYENGKIYYVLDGKIVAASSGSSTPIIQQTVDAGLKLSISQSRLKIGKGNVTVTLTPSVTHSEYVSGYDLDGTTYTDLSGITSVKIISKEKPLTRTFILSATPKPETAEYKYTANPASATLTIYKPNLIGNSGNLQEIENINDEISIDVVSGQKVYIYTIYPIKKVTASGFEFPVINNGIKSISYFDLDSVKYYEYETAQTISDSTLTIEITLNTSGTLVDNA